MTFLPGIPVAAEAPSQSRPKIADNFTALNTVFAVDHLAFNAVNGGEHQQVTFNSVIADPGLANPKSSLYTKTVAGDSQLFFENLDVGGGLNVVRQMTDLTITTVGTNYGVTTPWGLVLNWGVCQANNAGLLNTFAITFPTACLSVVATGGNAAQPTNVIKVTTVIPASFVGRSPAGETGYYIAIGN